MTVNTTDAVVDEEARQITLPDRIASRVEARLPRTSFETTDEYVAYVLEEVLARVDDATGGEEYESVDEREVESRLKSLGYME